MALRSGIEDDIGRLHILRHAFCSRLADRGVPARHIQKLAGHASITTTVRYMHYTNEGPGKAIATLDGEPVRCIGAANEQGSRRSPVSSNA